MVGKRSFKFFLSILITTVIIDVHLPNKKKEKVYVKVSTKGKLNSYRCLKIVWGKR